MSHTRLVTRDKFILIMPGPCNNRRKKKQLARRDKKLQHIPQPAQTFPEPPQQLDDLDDPLDDPHPHASHESPHPYDDRFFIATPNIYDPGNGPRVRDTRAFLSSFFAQPPAWDDELCAEFAQEEVLQMLCTVLPEEFALVRSLLDSTRRCRPLSRSCGTTRAGPRVVSVPRVDACIVWVMPFRTLSRTPPSYFLNLHHCILFVNRRYLGYVGDFLATGRCSDNSMPQAHHSASSWHHSITPVLSRPLGVVWQKK